MNKNKIIFGPFETDKNLGLIGLDNKAIYLIYLDLSSTFKYSVSQQIPFIYTNFIDKLISKPIQDLISKYQYKKLQFSDDFALKLSKSKLWKHTISIKYKSLEITWNVLNRNEFDTYEKTFRELNGEKMDLE